MTTSEMLTPTVRRFNVPAEDGNFDFTGRQLASVSSRWRTHGEHAGATATTSERCSACRWTEIEIYRADTSSINAGIGSALARYLVVVLGSSAVPGEETRRRLSWTNSPFEVVEVLTQRRGGVPTLPGPAARALARAAEFDDGLNEAYVNRAVA